MIASSKKKRKETEKRAVRKERGRECKFYFILSYFIFSFIIFGYNVDDMRYCCGKNGERGERERQDEFCSSTEGGDLYCVGLHDRSPISDSMTITPPRSTLPYPPFLRPSIAFSSSTAPQTLEPFPPSFPQI